MSRLPFWSDDFDMDLLKVMPFILDDLGPSADIPLWTVGRETHGRLNHPAVWNSHGALVWTAEPHLTRDEHGWFNVYGCVSNDPIVECTWLELLRDQWPHGYAFLLLPQQALFRGPSQKSFDCLMYHIRGLESDEASAEKARMASRLWAIDATRQLKAILAGDGK